MIDRLVETNPNTRAAKKKEDARRIAKRCARGGSIRGTTKGRSDDPDNMPS